MTRQDVEKALRRLGASKKAEKVIGAVGQTVDHLDDTKPITAGEVAALVWEAWTGGEEAAREEEEDAGDDLPW